MRCHATLFAADRQGYACHREQHDSATHFDASKGVMGVTWSVSFEHSYPSLDVARHAYLEFRSHALTAEDLT